MNPLYKERFKRAIGIMNESQLAQIKNTKIAIGGLGLGGSVFINLVRMGFEQFHVSDPDIYERTNINRQRMAKETTIGVRKDDALIKEALEINPDLRIKSFPEGLDRSNVSAFLDGVDWAIDIVDVFALDAKLALHDEANRRGIPIVSCGAIGFSASVVVFDPSSPTFAQLTGIEPSRPFKENLNRFAEFICPEVPEYMQEQVEKALRGESYIPFVVPGVEVAAAFVTSEIAKEILGLGAHVRAPRGIHIDPVKLDIKIYDAFFAGERAKLKKVA